MVVSGAAAHHLIGLEIGEAGDGGAFSAVIPLDMKVRHPGLLVGGKEFVGTALIAAGKRLGFSTVSFRFV